MKKYHIILIISTVFALGLLAVVHAYLHEKNSILLQVENNRKEEAQLDRLDQERYKAELKAQEEAALLNQQEQAEVQKQQQAATASRIASCKIKAKNLLVKTFQIACAEDSHTDEAIEGCYSATFQDIEDYARYSMTVAPNGETARLWKSYEADIKACK